MTSNHDGFQFPGEYCGQYGVYEAVRHLMSRSAEHKHLLKDDSMYISRNHFASEMEKIIGKERSVWRAEKGIPEDATVVFFAPGNEAAEAEFSMSNVRRGIKEF